MPRSVALIQAQIDIIEARLASAASLDESVSSDGTSIKQVEYEALNKRLERLYIQRDRASGASPMIVRGRVDGLRGSIG